MLLVVFVVIACDCICLIVVDSAGGGCLVGYGLVVCKRADGLGLAVLGCGCS